MRYSYCWELTPGDLDEARLPDAYQEGEWPYGRRYVNLEGVLRIQRIQGNVVPRGDEIYVFGPIPDFRLSNGRKMVVHLKGGGIADDETKREVPGRLEMMGEGDRRGGITRFSAVLEVGDGRLTGASIAGLVVGAMGVFVFAVALRHWLGASAPR